jgi:fumarate reductase flavoprotein subunit
MTSTENILTNEFPKHYLEGQKGMVSDRDAYWTEGDLPMYLGWCADSLAVDKHGERFAAETGVGMLDPWLAGPAFFSIWSDTQIDKIAEEGFDAMNGTIFFGSGTAVPNGIPIPNTDAVIDAAVDAGIMVKADTVAGLAEQLGMDPATLEKTVATYNGYCETGVDEQFGKPDIFLDKVEGNAYYAVKMFSYAYGSCGGLDINEHFQVLKTDGETPINGLYAVGTDSMGVLFTDRKPYVTYGGVNNSWGLTSGMMLGRELAGVDALQKAA